VAEPRRVYLDHNASSPLRPAVAQYLGRAAAEDNAGNPSSVHAEGQAARARLNAARRKLAEALRTEPRNVCFASSGTEANVWALQGAYEAREGRPPLIVASAIEHPSILLALEALARQREARFTLVPPEADGTVSAARMIETLHGGAALCTLQWANNETGVLQPVEAVAQACEAQGIPFHSDAVQAFGRVPLPLREIPVGMVSVSSHKLGGPAGLAALVARAPLSPLIPGHQEGGRRGGTPFVAGCEAFALAATLSTEALPAEATRLEALRSQLEQQLRTRFPEIRIHGAEQPRVPNTTSFTLPGQDAEALLIALDLDGVAVSTGAACASGSLTPSHVLLAMGLSPQDARATLRVSMGHTTQEEDVERFLGALFRHVAK
jgi:cysteine desulfurase